MTILAPTRSSYLAITHCRELLRAGVDSEPAARAAAAMHDVGDWKAVARLAHDAEAGCESAREEIAAVKKARARALARRGIRHGQTTRTAAITNNLQPFQSLELTE